MADDNKEGTQNQEPANKGLTQEEVLKLQIEKARLEERTKLHETLQKVQKEKEEVAAALDSERKAKGDQVQELEAAKKKLESLEKSLKKEGKELDVDKLIEEVSSRTANSVKQQYDAEMQKVTQQLNQLQEQNRQFQMAKLKNDLIAQNGGESSLIVELVNGSTEEEIKASIERSKAAFNRILAANAKGGQNGSANTTQNNANAAANVLPNPPSESGRTTSTGDNPQLLDRVRAMTPEEYAKNRAVILQQVQGRYPAVSR